MSLSPHTSHRRLMVAVLQDAVAIILSPGRLRGGRRRLLHETIAWVRSDDVAWPFSFLNVCEAVDLDAYRLRHRLGRFLQVAPLGCHSTARCR